MSGPEKSTLSRASGSPDESNDGPAQDPPSPETVERIIKHNAQSMLRHYFTSQQEKYNLETSEVKAFCSKIVLPLPVDNSADLQILETIEGFSSSAEKAADECAQKACQMLHRRGRLVISCKRASLRPKDTGSSVAQANIRKKKRTEEVEAAEIESYPDLKAEVPEKEPICVGVKDLKDQDTQSSEPALKTNDEEISSSCETHAMDEDLKQKI